MDLPSFTTQELRILHDAISQYCENDDEHLLEGNDHHPAHTARVKLDEWRAQLAEPTHNDGHKAKHAPIQFINSYSHPDLTKAVQKYVIDREETVGTPDISEDETEGGLTDYAYFSMDDIQTPDEASHVFDDIKKAAGGRKIWRTYDGVGYRLFFGDIPEILERIGRLQDALCVQNVLDS